MRVLHYPHWPGGDTGSPDGPDFAGSEVPYKLGLSDKAPHDDEGHSYDDGLRMDVTGGSLGENMEWNYTAI